MAFAAGNEFRRTKREKCEYFWSIINGARRGKASSEGKNWAREIPIHTCLKLRLTHTHTLAQCRPLNTHSLAIEIYRPERKGDGESVRASEVGKVGTGNVGSAKCVAQRVARFTFTLAGTFIQGHGADRTSQTTNGGTQKQKDTCILYPHSGYCGYFRSVSYKYLNSVILNN